MEVSHYYLKLKIKVFLMFYSDKKTILILHDLCRLQHWGGVSHPAVSPVTKFTSTQATLSHVSD